jgi:succinyl-CoA synthetase alpha subunit
MAIFLSENTRVLVQGITGRDGSFHTKQMLDYGTKIVAGVTPGKKGESVYGVPVYNSVKEAVKEKGANTSIIFVPAKFAQDAIYEAIDAGIKLIVVITEGIPALQMAEVKSYIKGKNVRIIGPNCPGIIAPGIAKVGIMPGNIFKKGKIGVVSRSGTLTYEVVYHLSENNLGQSTVVGIGGDPIIGTKFIDVLKEFEKDEETEGIVLIGEIGGTDEEEAAEFIKNNISKPVVAFIAGRTAPPEKRMGHAGAIIIGEKGTAESKIRAFEEVNVKVATEPQEVAKIMKEILK